MDAQKISLFMMTNGKYFPQESLPLVQQRLETLDDSRASVITFLQYKDPTVAIILSVLLGELGIDRFYVGDILLGVCKLLTFGGCGIWWLIDIFLIQGATRRKNYEKFMTHTVMY